MTTDERKVLYKKEIDSVHKYSQMDSLPRRGPVTTVLKTCRAALEAGKFAEAKQQALSALSPVYDLSFIPNQADSMRGIALMYLGATYHGQGELDDALVHYREAETHFGHAYNGQYAQAACYAQALIYTWQGQNAKADEIAASLETRSWTAASLRELSLRRKAIQARLDAERAEETPPPPNASSLRTNDGSVNRPEYVPTSPVFEEPGHASGLSLSSILGRMAGALPIVFSRRLTVDAPPNCWTVLKRGTEYSVVHTRPVIRQPFDRVHAFVPLNAYQTSIPKQKVIVSKDESVELQVVVGYAFHPPDPATCQEDVMRAIGVAEEALTSKNGQPQKTLYPADLRRGWEKRLQSDVALTLLDVVPKHDPQDLYCDRGAGTNRVEAHLRENLDARVQRWGLQIVEVRITDCKHLKAGN